MAETQFESRWRGFLVTGVLATMALVIVASLTGISLLAAIAAGIALALGGNLSPARALVRAIIAILLAVVAGFVVQRAEAAEPHIIFGGGSQALVVMLLGWLVAVAGLATLLGLGRWSQHDFTRKVALGLSLAVTAVVLTLFTWLLPLSEGLGATHGSVIALLSIGLLPWVATGSLSSGSSSHHSPSNNIEAGGPNHD